MNAEAFLMTVRRYRDGGWRLAIVNATALLPTEELPAGAFDVTWSFAKGTEFETIAERVMPGDEVPSISELFGAAFLYENEMRELFGINVTGIALDLGGQLYKTATKVPFSPSAIRARLESFGRLEHGAKHEAKPAPAPRPAAPAAAPAPKPAPAAAPAATAEATTQASATPQPTPETQA